MAASEPNDFFSRHERRFEANRFVYPVISRRSQGLSIGVNLNPDKVCNFDCVYCQVDRSVPGDTRFVDLDGLIDELAWMVPYCASGAIFEHEAFRDTPASLRRLSDLAFSGDGEPTTHVNFDEVIERCADIKRARVPSLPMILITNASMLHRPHVLRGLSVLDRNHGEIWAKLDAGTAEYFARINRTPVPFDQIVRNILRTATDRPVVIQSLFLRYRDARPSSREIDAYIRRLCSFLAGGGRIRYVQVYTVARRPAESFVAPLHDEELEEIRERIERESGIPARPFSGVVPEADRGRGPGLWDDRLEEGP